jgi:two-component system response regulator FixJ
MEMSTSDEIVFIVDDDEADRDSLAALLDTYGFRTRNYASAQEFLDQFAPAARGCLLLDVRLPGMSGLELQERLTAEGVRLPIIVITAYGDVPTAVRAMKAGAVEFIEKPYDGDVVVSAIRSVLDHESRASRQEAETAEFTSRLGRLTPRERQVMDELVIGRQNKEIAYTLGISPRTVEIHRARVMDKMSAGSLSHLVRMAILAGRAGGPSA